MNRTVLDDLIISLTALPTRTSQQVVFVGTRTSLRYLSADNPTELWGRHGTCQRLTPLRAGTSPRLLAVSQDGRARAFDP